jgi:dihydrofolate reductase
MPSTRLPPFTLHAVVAMAANRVIGANGRLPWHEPEDLKFFKKLTSGHPVIMGRKTFESIGKPLPNRRNLVLSRKWTPPAGVEVVPAPEALSQLGLEGDVFVIGGAEVFRHLLPYCQSVVASHLHASYPGDALMPPFEHDFPRAEKLLTFPSFEVWRHWRQV